MTLAPASSAGAVSPTKAAPAASRHNAQPENGPATIVQVSALIAPDGVIATLAAASKADVLRLLAYRAAGIIGVDGAFLFDLLMAREQLGSTAAGRGYALPHTEWKGLSGFFGLFARLAKPVEFGALDGRRVDLVFMLLSPENAGKAHVEALAAITRRLRNSAVAATLRATRDAQKLYETLIADPG